MDDEQKAQTRALMMQKLIDGGHKQRLMEELKQSLTRSGWRQDVKDYCKTIIRQQGIDKVTTEEVSSRALQYARQRVPDEVKEQLVRRIREILTQSEDGEEDRMA
ncbi:Transcription and mRNA export factor eny2 [Gonapodya sp. JEL0774]|nr:Transcription and mRNA export factor eny2 [Gonapodya sp. JEL0774]